jgi:hypothetical protein
MTPGIKFLKIYRDSYATNSLSQVQNSTILCLSGSEFKIVLIFWVLFVSRQKEQNLSNETASLRNKATQLAMRTSFIST